VPSWDEMVRQTIEHMNDPQPGDRFQEMYSFWVHVVVRQCETIIVEEYSPPAEVPKDARVRMFPTLAAFRAAYGDDGHTAGYWINYCDNKAYLDHVARYQVGAP
jgi:hypothetical protein